MKECMSRSVRSSFLIVFGLLVAGCFAFFAARRPKPETVASATIHAAPLPPPTAPSPWCGEGVETVHGDTCYLDGRGGTEAGVARRTLVIWLHGVIGKNTNWSHDHEKMLLRMAKAAGIEVLFPKGVLAGSVYAWPGTLESQTENEEALIEQWMIAKDILAKREKKPFDETFIFGFSSGAYFASSLALRGRVDVDGYAVFAGGQAMPAAAAPTTRFAPVFVGICEDDPTGTAAHGRAFASSLAAAGIPFRVSEEAVGHDLSPTQFTSALAFLRQRAAASGSISPSRQQSRTGYVQR
jgi:predicted esterase